MHGRYDRVTGSARQIQHSTQSPRTKRERNSQVGWRIQRVQGIIPRTGRIPGRRECQTGEGSGRVEEERRKRKRKREEDERGSEEGGGGTGEEGEDD